MNKQTPPYSIYDTTIRLFVVLLIIGWCLMIMYPFVSIILWSLILALAIYPLHTMLAKKMGGRPKLASVIIVVVILAIVILPTWLLIDKLFNEVKALKVSYENGTLTIPPPSEKVKTWPVVGEKLYDTWNAASVDLEQLVIKYKDQLLGVGKKVAMGILSAFGSVIQIMAALIIAGILVAFGGTGEGIRKFFRKLAGDRGDEFADMTLKTVGNVVKGILGVALILALLNGIVLMLAGVPYAGIWTLLIFILGVLQIPLFFVTLPIVIYLFAMKGIGAAILWSVALVLVGFSDNILRPILLGKGAPVPMLVIFIGVIGGFILSGFIGLFTGAIVFSLGYKLYIGWVNSGEEIKQPE
ncbi:MAG: AI-2E family transporter [Bacteroidetes bacterium]|nr:AI-2E family transporter [Bacteroidota bacterium]